MSNPNDTKTSLLHAFTLPKPAASAKEPGAVSKPNHDKVDGLSTGLFFATLRADCGIGSLLSVSLEVMRKATLSILANADADKFAVVQETILNQLDLLKQTIKGLSPAGAVAEHKAFMDAAMQKMKAPSGPVSDEPSAGDANSGVTLGSSQAIPVDALPKDPKQLEVTLEKMLADLKAGDKDKAN